MVVWILAALGPGLNVVKLFRVREFTRTFTLYGKLQEPNIFVTDYGF